MRHSFLALPSVYMTYRFSEHIMRNIVPENEASKQVRAWKACPHDKVSTPSNPSSSRQMQHSSIFSGLSKAHACNSYHKFIKQSSHGELCVLWELFRLSRTPRLSSVPGRREEENKRFLFLFTEERKKLGEKLKEESTHMEYPVQRSSNHRRRSPPTNYTLLI